jgi:hypothetical protein
MYKNVKTALGGNKMMIPKREESYSRRILYPAKEFGVLEIQQSSRRSRSGAN